MCFWFHFIWCYFLVGTGDEDGSFNLKLLIVIVAVVEINL